WRSQQMLWRNSRASEAGELSRRGSSDREVVMSINPFFKAGAMLLMVVVVSGGGGESSRPSPSTTEPVATEAGQAPHRHDDHDHDHDHDHYHGHQPFYREAGCHQHGVAEMTLVLEEGLLKLGLNLPSVDVLGFVRA